ncbi:MAG TPA: alpha/beta fold hydrolase [Streptosporangiaceae bacterium]|jgi:pimeloyl-ACP methyl ester carboxylesterase
MAVGFESRFVDGGQGRLHVLARDGMRAPGPVLCLVHGNLSSARFFEPLVAGMPRSWRVLAPDLRGFGRSGPAPVDATRGVGDFADDIAAVLADPDLVRPHRRVHLAGWSLGGDAVMRYAIDHPERVASVTLIAPGSPFGFGGTKDDTGTLCYPDAAGSGAGLIAAELLQRLKDGDDTGESPLSPRSVLRSHYLWPGLRLPATLEDQLVGEILATALGDASYPGDQQASANWPGVAPGTHGVANALSPLYCDVSGFAEVAARWPVLWVRGADDLIVSDHSPADTGELGATGALPGWPGPEFPAQPMVAQTRAMLRRAEAAGGRFTEHVIPRCGHSPHLERPEELRELLAEFVTAAESHPRGAAGISPAGPRRREN